MIYKEKGNSRIFAEAPVSPDPVSKKESSLVQEIASLFLKIFVIMLAFILMFTFLFGLVRYEEPEMTPAIKDGDLVIFYRFTRNGYLPQDVVLLEFEGKKQSRRVIATAGDKVDITEQGRSINGALQWEPEIYEETQRYEEGVDFHVVVPEGQIFVLADRRINATDSRVYGCIKSEDVLGKVIAILRRRNI